MMLIVDPRRSWWRCATCAKACTWSCLLARDSLQAISSPASSTFSELICTCKGYKVSSNCSHTIAVTALFITDAQCVSGWKSFAWSFDRGYLETLLEKVTLRTRAAHRPRNIVAGTRIQPTDDTVEEEGDGEESEDEDLDDM
jgi:hypothetical protein